jgi:hypothetical protein
MRVSLAAGYTSPDVSGQLVFSEMMEQAESALQRALDCSKGEKIASFFEHEEAVEQTPAFTDEDMRMAFQYILEGSYFQVPDDMLQAVAEKLNPFLDYVAKRTNTGRTGTDNA